MTTAYDSRLSDAIFLFTASTIIVALPLGNAFIISRTFNLQLINETSLLMPFSVVVGVLLSILQLSALIMLIIGDSK